MRLRTAEPRDAAAIAAIYAPYVTGSVVSFETEPPGAEAIAERMAAAGDLYPWIVAEDEAGGLLGYAYASAFRARPAYRFAVESSIYLAEAAHRQGLGRRLYASLIETVTAQGFAQCIGAITLPNAASVRLHEALRFEKVGTYRQVGYKMGGWHDVGLWQRALAPAGSSPDEPRTLSEVELVLL